MSIKMNDNENLSISEAMNYNFDSNLIEVKNINENQSTDLINSENIEKPSFFSEKIWKNYKLSFPWLAYSGTRFWCLFCDDAFKRNEGAILTDWVYDKSIKTAIESKNKYNISRCRFDRHSKSLNHIFSLKLLNKVNIETNDEWKFLKDKYSWLNGDLENTRCSICEESYKKHKKSMIITIWTCPELKSKQSKSHFTIEHRLDRHEKCNNHLLAVKLESDVDGQLSPLTSLSINRKSPMKNRSLSNDKQIENIVNNSPNINNRLIDQEKTEFIKQSQSPNLISDGSSPNISFEPKITRRSLTNKPSAINIPTRITRTPSLIAPKPRSKRRSITMKRKKPIKHSLVNSLSLSTSNISNVNKVECLDTPISPFSVRRSRKSAPIKSRKQSDVLPVSISPHQFSTLKSRFQWLLCNNETSFLCEICINSKVFIQFECDATFPYISRRILSHSHSEIHIHNLDARGIHTTRLQLGIHQKIDYKQLLNGTDNHSDQKIDVGSWSCPQCKSQFDHQSSLIEHISLCDYQSTEVIRELSCPCNPTVYRFNTITKLDLHAVQEHSHKQLFNCYICSERCNRLLLLYGHMLIHHLIDWDPFGSYIPLVIPSTNVECIFCSTSYITHLELNNHYCHSPCNKYLQPVIALENIEESVLLLKTNEVIDNYFNQNELLDNNSKSEHNSVIPPKEDNDSKSDMSKLLKFESLEYKETQKRSSNRKNRKNIPKKCINNNEILEKSKSEEHIIDTNQLQHSPIKTVIKITKKLHKKKVKRRMKSLNLSKVKSTLNDKLLNAGEKEVEDGDDGILYIAEEANSDIDTHIPKKELISNERSLFSQKLSEIGMTMDVSNESNKVNDILSTHEISSTCKDLIGEYPKEKLVDDKSAIILEKTSNKSANRTKKKTRYSQKSKKTKNRKNLFSLKLSEMGVKSKSADMDEAPLEELLRVSSKPNYIKKEKKAQFCSQLENEEIEKDQNNSKESTEGILKEIDNDHQEVYDNSINVLEESLNGATVIKLTEQYSDVVEEANNKVLQSDIELSVVDNSPKENIEIVSLNQLKICVEKMDIDVKKRRYKKRLMSHTDSVVISPELEKRIRVPSEKLKNSVDYVESVKRRSRLRIPSERFKESKEYDEKFMNVVSFNDDEWKNSQNLVESVNFIEKKKRRRKIPLNKLKLSLPPKLNINRRNVPLTINDLSGLKKSQSEQLDKTNFNRKDNLKKISKRSLRFSNRFKKSLNDVNVADNEMQPKSTSKRIGIRTKSDNSETAPSSEIHLNEDSNVNRHSSLDEIILAVVSEVTMPSPESVKVKKPIIIQSQLSPPEKIVLSFPLDEECIPAELSFMDRMKRIRQLKKIRSEQQREQMMVVDRTVAEINEKVHDDTMFAKAEEIKKLLTCEQYSMTDLKNILHSARKKRHSIDIDEYKPTKRSKIESVKKEKTMFGCEVCGLKFNSTKKRDCHISKEHKKCKLFKCKTCNMSLATHLGLRKHAIKFHPDNVSLAVFGKENHMDIVTTFQCHYCLSQFPTKYLLNSHMANAHLDNSDKQKSLNESVSCPIVIDEFLEKLIEANPINCSQPCQICNEMMENEFELAIHTIEHERENDFNFEANQFACPKCCRLFFGREGKTYLKDHYNIIHLQKPYPSCDECKTEFSSTWCYYEHKRTVKNCSKKSIDQLSGLIDPYEQLNDPLRLAFVCSRCQTLVAGACAQKRFLKHETDCSLQLADDEEEDSVEIHISPVDHSI